MTGLLFDYDGTLHESLRIYAPAMQAVYDGLSDRGLAPPRQLTDREVRSWIGMPPERSRRPHGARQGTTWGYKKKQEVSVSEEAGFLPYVLLMTRCPTGLGGIHP